MTAQALLTPETATQAEWWRGAVIYQIYPRSFADSNGDGIGDLPGVLAHLDHVAALGVDAVWLSPFFPSPGRDFGYDVADFCAVDPMFGTLADFDALVARAHDLGLKVLIDQVYSHTSDQHDWFVESRADRSNPKADWYVWVDPKPDGSPPSNWQAVFGGACWTWDARRGQYYLHNFLPEQPDLNLHHPEVRAAILDVARFWLDRGVDGFRLDAVNFWMHDPQLRDNPPAVNDAARTRPFDFQQHLYNQSHPDIPAFLAELRAVADGYGERFLLAEVGGERAAEEMKLYTTPPHGLHSAYNFVYLYADALTPNLVRENAASWREDGAEGWPAWTFSNHDAPRAVSRWSEGKDPAAVARQLMLLLICLRGNAIIYQGEELGLPQGQVPFERLQDPEAIANWPLTLGRDGARTPMPWRSSEPFAGFSTAEPWLPMDAAHLPLAVDAQADDPGSTLAAVRRAVALRGDLPALRRGGIRILPSEDPILVFERADGGDRAVCAFNLGDAPAAWTPPQGLRVVHAVNWGGGAMLEPGAGVVTASA